MRISRNNYLAIQGWMITDLKLSGNELLCYALIYGFCQDGETKYAGSSSYICEWLSCSKKTALTTLKALTDKGYIIKYEKVINGVKLCDYAVNFDLVPDYTTGEKITPEGEEFFTLGGREKITPHNYLKDNYLKDNPPFIIPPQGKDDSPKGKIKLDEVDNFEKLFLYWEQNKAGKKYKTDESRQRMLAKLKELTFDNLDFAKEVILFCIDNRYQGFTNGSELYYTSAKASEYKKAEADAEFYRKLEMLGK